MHGWHRRVQGMESVMLQLKRPAEQIRQYESILQMEYVRKNLNDVQIQLLLLSYHLYPLQNRPVQ